MRLIGRLTKFSSPIDAAERSPAVYDRAAFALREEMFVLDLPNETRTAIVG